MIDFFGKCGVTLFIKLLILNVLFVGLVVLMLQLSKPVAEQVQFSTEAIPVIAQLRVRISMFQMDKRHLPGIPMGSNNKPKYEWVLSKNLINYRFSSSYLGQTISMDCLPATGFNPLDTIQTVAFVKKYSSEIKQAHNAVKRASDGLIACENLSDAYIWNYHFLNELGLDHYDFTGARMNADYIEYVVLADDGYSYAYVIGCFGDGGKLPKGSGYAVLEVNDAITKRKFTATFKRYKPKNNSQLTFSYDFADLNTRCVLPDPSILFGATSADVEKNDLFNKMKEAGWKIEFH